MACPHVAGAAAILLANNSTLSPAEIKNMMLLKSISGAVSDPGTGSPNLLLYMGEGNGGGYIPDPEDPQDPGNGDPTCGGFFNETSGSFTSPNYPSDYDNSLTCDYAFRAGTGDVVTVSFSDFSLESSSTCAYDYVRIYDGDSTSATMIGEYCGSDSPGIVSSSGSDMFIRFSSDYSVTYPGFTANYLMGEAPEAPETGGCGHTFTSKYGLLTSPNHPSEYSNNVDCDFFIKGLVGETVTLSFSAFDIENHSSCAYDALEIYDGDNTGALLAKLCGSTIPSSITTSSNTMYVRFTTDGSVTRTGFSASYVLN